MGSGNGSRDGANDQTTPRWQGYLLIMLFCDIRICVYHLPVALEIVLISILHIIIDYLMINQSDHESRKVLEEN